MARLKLSGKPEYEARLEKELEVVSRLGFVPYFLVMWDIARYVRTRGLVPSPGRGSGAGSLLCYCLGITGVDPLRYHLLFERFINESRVSPPDIDYDTGDRDSILNYIEGKYGSDHVARVGTIGFLRSKSAIRTIGKVLEKPQELIEELVELVPPPVAGLWESFQAECDISPGLRDEKYADLIPLVEQAWGLARSMGTHAGGIAISPTPITDFVPLYSGKDDKPTSQFDWRDLEKAGLLKFDILGLKTLEVLQTGLKLLADDGIEVDLEALEDGDPLAYDLICRGDLDGVFQLGGSEGIKQNTIAIRPRNIEDISAATSLFRPGPLCLSGDSLIACGTQKICGEPTKLYWVQKPLHEMYEAYAGKNDRQLAQNPWWVVSVGGSTLAPELAKSKVKAVHKGEIKDLYRLVVRTCLTGPAAGAKATGLKASLDHGFLTLTGWKRLSELAPGDYILVRNERNAGYQKNRGAKVQGRKNFKNIAFYNYEYRCVFCNWSEGSLDTNHIHENRNKNNDPENLSFLCPNHHRLYSEGKISPEELTREQGKYRIHPTRHLRWVRFEGLEPAGTEQTYDLELEGPLHNFIADGHVVHNSSGMVDTYIAVRSGKESVSYLHPKLEPILESTMGVVVYQEQVMRICVELCGYTLPEADNMRKILGKKLKDKMAAEGPKFIAGAVKGGLTQEEAEGFWEKLKDYGQYLFNKCLSADTEVFVKTHDTPWLPGKPEPRVRWLPRTIQELYDSPPEEPLMLLSFDPESGNIQQDECREIIPTGEQEVFEIELSDGSKVVCTMDHKFLCGDMEKHTLREILDRDLDVVSIAK